MIPSESGLQKRPIRYKQQVGISPQKSRITRILLSCGIVSSLFYLFMNVFVPLKYEGYNSASQTISELSAIDAPTRDLWVALGVIYALLTFVFGLGILRSTPRKRSLRITGILMMFHGVTGMLWPLFPMHQRQVLAAGGGSITDTMHIVLSAFTVLLMMVMIGISSIAFGNKFKVFSFVTIVLLVCFGALTGLNSPDMEANRPTPWMGVWERISIGVYMVWVMVLAGILLAFNRRKVENPL